MPIAAIISLCLTAGLLILSFIFKVAGKIRLSIPIICFLLFSTVLNKWAGEHETLAFIILFSLLGLTVLSWIVSLIKAIRRKRRNTLKMMPYGNQRQEMGVPLDKIQFNENGICLIQEQGSLLFMRVFSSRYMRIRTVIPDLPYNPIISRTTRSAIFTAPPAPTY